jgi:hypothetical protein
MKRRAATLAGALAMAALLAGCAHRETRRLRHASRQLGKDVAKGDEAAIAAHVLPGARAGTDVAAMHRGTAAKSWSRALAKPVEVSPRATILLAPDHPVDAVWTAQGWKFDEDPLDVYAQDTPRHALRALVTASRHGRWDVMIRLAPQRYRVGLAAAELETAWTEGDSGAELRRARDLLADHLGDPIVADADEASLALPEGRVARLEREADRWVVVDF